MMKDGMPSNKNRKFAAVTKHCVLSRQLVKGKCWELYR